MNDHTTEDRIRKALATRAAEVEPSPAAYAQLAHRLTLARHRPWWRAPRTLWFASAGFAAAALISVVVLATNDDNNKTNVVAPPPEESASSPEQTTTDPPEKDPPDKDPSDGVQPGDLAAAEAAAEEYLVQVHGWRLPVLSSRQDAAGHAFVSLAGPTDIIPEGEPASTERPVTIVELRPDDAGGWTVVAARNDDLVINNANVVQQDGPPAQSALVLEGTAATAASGTSGEVTIQVLDRTGAVIATDVVPAGRQTPEPFSVELTLPFAARGIGWIVLTDIDLSGLLRSITAHPIELPEIDPSLGGTVCSATGMTTPPRQPGLPDPVAATRDAIIAAALACDIEALVSLTGPSFTASFGGSSPEELWTRLEAEGRDPLRWMVTVLGLPARAGDIGEPGHTWPSAFGPDWNDLTPAEFDSIRPFFTDEEIEFFALSGSYTGYRLGITDSGVWTTFVAGD